MSAPAPHLGFGPSAPRGSAVVVHEVYASIQGESTYAGLPCVFVRLTACHLRCVWCDTPHAFHEGARRPVDDVVKDALAHGIPLVEVTGGEPLLQPGVHPLLTALADAGVTVLLETSGSLDIAGVDPRVVRIVDVKCPGSGEAESNRWPSGLNAICQIEWRPSLWGKGGWARAPVSAFQRRMWRSAKAPASR